MNVNREFQLPSLDNKSKLPEHVKVYPSFIDCLNEVAILQKFTLSKIIRNQDIQPIPVADAADP